MNQTVQLWPLKEGDNACPYCHTPLIITGKANGMYQLQCKSCDEKFITEAELFDRMILHPLPRMTKRISVR